MENHYLAAERAKLLVHTFMKQVAKYAVKGDSTTNTFFKSGKLRLKAIKQLDQDLKKSWKDKNKP